MAESDKTVYAAMGANLTVAVAKFVASAFTGSASMVAEGVHSLVDTGNNGLLLLGSRIGQREPDDLHPFGYGMEQYFWTVIVATIVFALGGGVSLFEGVHCLLEPEPIEKPIWNYAVLVVAFVSDGYSWLVAFRQLRRSQPDENVLQAAKISKDPSNFAIWFEDSAAVVGVVIAFVGVLLSHLLESGIPDGIASILIALTMAATAVMLIYESKKLLIGEAAEPEIVSGIRALIEADGAVERCGSLLTMHLGPEDVLLNVDVQFRRGLSSDELIEAVDRLEGRIRSTYKEVRRIFIEPERLDGEGGCPIDSPGSAARLDERNAEACPAGRTLADS